MLFRSEIACNTATICVIGIASIYFYANANSTKLDIHGMDYSVILGGIFLVLAILDSIFFRPSLTYIELMASPCFKPAVFNTRMNVCDGTTRPCSSVYDAHLKTILGIIPFLGSLGDHKLEYLGIPMVQVMSGNYDSDQKKHYMDAAREIINRLENMYFNENATNNPMSV